jgi:hypothetical protein
MVLIGLHGRAGSGKDTTFLAIQKWAEERGLTAVRRGFADKLKLSAARIFYPDIDLEGALKWADDVKMDPDVMIAEGFLLRDYENIPIGFADKTAITGRQFFQRYGTEAHRQVFGETFWTDQVLPVGYSDPVQPKFWANFPDADIAVVTDVRFEDEAQRVKDLNGHVWEIHRDEIDRGGGRTHASESPIPVDLIDQTIYNSASIEVLNSTVKSVLTDNYERLFR